MSIVDALTALITASGPLWLAAFVVAFLAAACEASAPRLQDRHGEPLSVVAGVASAITPFLLLIHAYLAVTMKRNAIVEPTEAMMRAVQAADGALLLGVVVLIALMITAPLLPGHIVRRTAPEFGAVLRRAAPILHLVAFALAVFATRESVIAAMLSVLRGTPLAAG